MSEMITISKTKLASLEERVKKLAADKSNLQLVAGLMSRVAAIAGLDNVVEHMLHGVSDLIGGVNVKLYYHINDELWCADILLGKRKLPAVDDAMVQRATETREFMEIEHPFRDTQMMGPEFTKAYTWAVPLLVGAELVGVLKMESLHVAARDLSRHLSTFFSFAALVLKNEISGHSRLQKAYADLEHEMAVRKGAEEQLRRANEELESRVALRTEELREANGRLVENDRQIRQLLRESETARTELVGLLAEQKAAEEAQRRLNRELRAISNCNLVLMRAVDEQSLLNDVCRIVCGQAGYRMAWVGFAEHDKFQTVRPMAWAGFEEDYLRTADITWADTDHGRGPTGSAIRNGESACIQDFATDPNARPWREEALRRGYRSSIALPLKDDQGGVFGALTIYSAETNAFDPGEIRLLEELGRDLAFGIVAVRTREERKRVEDKLRHLAAIVESTDDAVIGKTLDGTIVSWNRGAEQLYGYSAVEIVGRPVSILIPPERQAEFADIMEKLKAGEKIQHFETLRVHKDGRSITVALTVCPIKDSGGRLVGASTIARDTTERRRAAQRLAEAEAKYRCLVEESLVGVYVIQQGRFVYVNACMARVFGYRRDELVGRPVDDLVAPEDRDRVTGNVEKRETGQVPSVHYMFHGLRKEGQIIDVEVLGTRTVFDDRPAVIGSLLDVTERKRAEQERAEHLRFFECMDRINRAIQANNDLEQVMGDVLDTMLSIFGCDRAFLATPCDPNMPEFQIFMERTTPQYPGAFARRMAVPMSPAIRNLFRELLSNPAPNEIYVGNGLDPEDVVWKTHQIQSQLAIALHPKVGKPWECGLHQCSHNRAWSPQDKKLFLEISRRLGDALTSLLTYRNLQESEQRFRMVFENSPVSIGEEDYSGVKAFFDGLRSEGVTDIEAYFGRHPEAVRQCGERTRFVDVNQAALALHGAASKEELLARMEETFTPETRQVFRQALVCLWNGVCELRADTVVNTLAGELRHVSLHFSVCPGYEQTLARVLVSLTDITVRKRMEDALLFVAQRGWQTGAEDFLNALARFLCEKLGMDYAFVDKVDEHREMAETVALCARGSIVPNIRYALKGTPCENVIGRNLCVYRQGIQQMFPDDALLPQMGAESYIGIPLWDSTGKPIGLIAVMSSKPLADDAPLTQVLQLVATRAAAELERKQTEEKLVKLNAELEQRVRERTVELQREMDSRFRQQQFLEAVLESTDAGIVACDADGVLTFFNRRARELHGLPATSIPAEQWAGHYDLFLPDGKTPMRREDIPLFRALQGERVVNDEMMIIPRGGEPKVLLANGQFILDKEGRKIGAVVAMHDITERKRAELAIRKLNAELQQRANALEQVNKELEAFSYSVSHDLRAPLRSIDGFSRALLEDYADKLDNEGKENLRTVRAASQRMGHLIDDMLRLSHINRSEMRWGEVNLSQIAWQICGELKKAEPSREVEVVIAPDCVARGDAPLLRIALENILGNAWKYTGRKPRARIEFGVTMAEGGRAYFVRDDGCGFEMAYAHKLFGAFQRLHSAEEFPGTGVGLASVQRVIRRHGGKVWIEGEVDRGTTIYFTLPSLLDVQSGDER